MTNNHQTESTQDSSDQIYNQIKFYFWGEPNFRARTLEKI